MSRFFILLPLLALLLVGPMPALAGDEPPCASSKAASELNGCCICHELKSILKQTDAGLEVEIVELARGIVVRMDGKGEAGRAAAAQLANLLWMPSERQANAKFCSYCQARRDGLLKIEREIAGTDSGMLVVLSSSDDETLAWLHQDARKQRSFLDGVIAGR